MRGLRGIVEERQRLRQLWDREVLGNESLEPEVLIDRERARKAKAARSLAELRSWEMAASELEAASSWTRPNLAGGM